MILINKQIKILTLFIAIILLFNFIMIPHKVHAIDPITLTLGGLGLSYAAVKAIYLTTLVAAGVGVTFLAWDEAKKFHDIIEGTSPAPLDYPGWNEAVEDVKQSKAELANEHWFSQWGLEVLPGGQQDPDPDNNNKRSILGLLGGIGVMGGFINNYLSMFKTLELEEGNNKIYDNSILDVSFIPYSEELTITKSLNRTYNFYGDIISIKDITADNSNRRHIAFYVNGIPNGGYMLDVNSLYNIRKTETSQHYLFYFSNFNIAGINKSDAHLYEPEEQEIIFDFDVSGDSPIFFDGGSAGEIKLPQPNLIPIRRLKPQVQPNGDLEYVYPGDVDDLLYDIVMNTPIDEILNPEGNPYTIIPGKDKTVIIRPESDPTTPFPLPKPPTRPPIWPPLTPYPETWPEEIPYPEWPQPDPHIWPEPYPYPVKPTPWPPVEPVPWPDPDTWPPSIPYPYPDPNTWPPTIPYPFPQPEPNPNPSPVVPVEPGKQIDYTQWFQLIINWLSKIWNKIPVLPDVEVDPNVPDPFTPDPNYIKDKIEELQIKINNKLNLPDLTPLPALFEGIECEPIPDGFIDGHKVFDASYINNLASTIANWQRFLWWIVIILIGANNAYKLIRGTDLITIYGRGGKGN